MGLYLKLVNYDDLLANIGITPYVVNDHAALTEQDREVADRMTRTIYTNQDVYSNIPSCECGNSKGAFRIGTLCKDCKLPVKEVFDTNLQPRAWMRSPQGVARLINPVIWIMLSERFTRSDFNLIEWLCNTDYTTNANTPIYEIQELMAMGVQRGYNNFVNNFDAYYQALSSLKHFAKRKDDTLKMLIDGYRGCVFSRHVPLPNKSMLIVENTHFARYMDNMIEDVFDAITLMQGIDTPMSVHSLRQRENRTAKAITRMAKYHYQAYHEQIAKKGGLIRKHMLGSRLHFSARAVITSNTKPHKYDELAISWGQGVTLFRLHLLNKLMNKCGYTPNQAVGLLMEHSAKYSPLIRQLFDELFAETKDGMGFYVIYVNRWGTSPGASLGSNAEMKTY